MSLIEKLRQAKSSYQFKTILDETSTDEIAVFLTTKQNVTPEDLPKEQHAAYENGLDYLNRGDPQHPCLINSYRIEVILLALQRIDLSVIEKALKQICAKYENYNLQNWISFPVVYSIIAKEASVNGKRQCIKTLLQLDSTPYVHSLCSYLGYYHDGKGNGREYRINIPKALALLNTVDHSKSGVTMAHSKIAKLLLAYIYQQGMSNAGEPDLEKSAEVLSEAIGANNFLIESFILTYMEDLLKTKGIDASARHKIQWHLVMAYHKFLQKRAHLRLKLIKVATTHLAEWITYKSSEPASVSIKQRSAIANVYYSFGDMAYKLNRGDIAILCYKSSGTFGLNKGWLRAATGYMAGWHDPEKPHTDFEAALDCCTKVLQISDVSIRTEEVVDWLRISAELFSKQQKQRLVDRIWQSLYEYILNYEPSKLESETIDFLMRVIKDGHRIPMTSYRKSESLLHNTPGNISKQGQRHLQQSLLKKAETDLTFCIHVAEWIIDGGDEAYLLPIANALTKFASLAPTSDSDDSHYDTLDEIMSRLAQLSDTASEMPYVHARKQYYPREIYKALYPKYIKLNAQREQAKRRRAVSDAVNSVGSKKVTELEKLAATGDLDAKFHLALCILDDNMSRYTNSWRYGYRRSARKATAFKWLKDLAYNLHPDSIEKYFELFATQNPINGLKNELLRFLLQIAASDVVKGKQVKQIKSPQSPAWQTLIRVVETIQRSHLDDLEYGFICNFYLGILKGGADNEGQVALELAEQLNKEQFASLKTHLVNTVPWLSQQFEITQTNEQIPEAKKPDAAKAADHIEPSAPPLYPDMSSQQASEENPMPIPSHAAHPKVYPDMSQGQENRDNPQPAPSHDAESAAQADAASWVKKRRSIPRGEQVRLLAASRDRDNPGTTTTTSTQEAAALSPGLGPDNQKARMVNAS